LPACIVVWFETILTEMRYCANQMPLDFHTRYPEVCNSFVIEKNGIGTVSYSPPNDDDCHFWNTSLFKKHSICIILTHSSSFWAPVICQAQRKWHNPPPFSIKFSHDFI
jgi:hypothetical protein